MKSKAILKIIILITLGILFAFSPIITVNLIFNAGNNKTSSEYDDYINLDNENLKISATSGNIHIDGNSGWIAFKNDGNCTGEGTYSDPYIIEDLVIDNGSIYIENSDVYFKIENCTLYYSGEFGMGIYLYRANNSLIIRNNCSWNYYGIVLADCSNNTISGNIANNNAYGIFLWGDNNTISGNTANDNYWGIMLMGSNNIISGNNANDNIQRGIHLESGDNNAISGNTANNNWFGIVLLDSSNDTILGNIANNNTYYGIVLLDSSNDTIMGNTANKNTYYGIFLWGSNNNTITKNIINYNNNTGIVVDTSNGNNIYLNCFNNILNAIDNGSNNHWDNGINGNYWADYTDLDIDGNGIGDVPYNITGSAGSQDNFPLMKCPISVDSPEGGGIPFELIILISVISGGAVIGVATLLLIIRKRKRIE